MIRRLALLGTGLIGGSVGLRIRAEEGIAVAGYDERAGEAERARELGALDVAASTPEEAVADAQMVLVAVPVDRMHDLFTRIRSSVPEGAVVTDVGSSKEGVVHAGEKAFGDTFVGGHPMAGSERHGIEAADPTLFEDAWWILTPTATTSGAAYSQVSDLVGALGARPVALRPETHDALIARLSHLPQLAASALVQVAASAGDRESLGLAAGGFRDVTRIAASNPELWIPILRSNRTSVLRALSGFARELERLRSLLDKESWGEMEAFLQDAREARLELFAKAVYTGEPITLTMLIPDRPGVLAEVTTAAGVLGANIEDITIFHSTEGGRGRLELVVAGEEAAAALTEKLIGLGYHVEKGLPE
jgi:prephenate dehydrogenase